MWHTIKLTFKTTILFRGLLWIQYKANLINYSLKDENSPHTVDLGSSFFYYWIKPMSHIYVKSSILCVIMSCVFVLHEALHKKKRGFGLHCSVKLETSRPRVEHVVHHLDSISPGEKQEK